MGGLYPGTGLAVGVLGQFNTPNFHLFSTVAQVTPEHVLLPAFIFFKKKKKIRKRSSAEITKVTVQIFAVSLSLLPLLFSRHFALADACLWVHFFSAQGDRKFYKPFASSP